MAGLVERVPIQTGDPLNPQASPAISIGEGPGRVCVYVVFATDAEADVAAEKVREALANAVSLRRPGHR
jgi:hypothetical protein